MTIAGRPKFADELATPAALEGFDPLDPQGAHVLLELQDGIGHEHPLQNPPIRHVFRAVGLERNILLRASSGREDHVPHREYLAGALAEVDVLGSGG